MPTIAHVLCNAVFLTFFVVRDGFSGSDPLELTAEQCQALADAKALGLRLAHEAKMKECDKLDAAPFVVREGLSKIARAEKIGQEYFDVPSLAVLRTGFPTLPSEVAALRAELAECREQLRQSEINAKNSNNAAIAHAQDGAASRELIRELQARILELQEKDSK